MGVAVETLLGEVLELAEVLLLEQGFAIGRKGEGGSDKSKYKYGGAVWEKTGHRKQIHEVEPDLSRDVTRRMRGGDQGAAYWGTGYNRASTGETAAEYSATSSGKPLLESRETLVLLGD